MSGKLELDFAPVEAAVREAVLEGAEVFRSAVEENLQRHRSTDTKTTERQSAKTKSDQPTKELADSVVTYPTEQGAIVTIEKENAAKGYWLEFGFLRVGWGRGDATVQRPKPFMRPAYQNNRLKVVSKIAQLTKRKLG